MIARLARRLGCTEGQAWTLLLAGLLALVTVGLGLPPAFRGGATPEAAASAPSPPGPRIGPEDDVQVPVLVTLVETPATPTPPVVSVAAPPSSTTTVATSTTTTVGASPAAIALSVREGGWASSRGGTPIAAAEVSEGALPIGARAGETDELSFVRLAGTESVLRLGALDDPLAATAVLRACPIDDPAWEARENIALDDAPAYDCDLGVAGTLGDDQVWSFDLGAFADRAGQRGFALVPGEGPGTFRVRLAVTSQ